MSGAIIFAAGGEFIALVSVIMAITTMTNGHIAMNNDFAAYRAENNGDASDAKRYSSRNTYEDTLRKVSDSKLVHKFADGFEVVELTGNVILLFDCALNIGKGIVNLASKLLGKNSAPSSISEILSKVNAENQLWDDLAKTEDDAVKIGEGGSTSSKLDWDSVVSKKGEARVDHINKHGVDNLGRDTHTVFNDDPITTTNKAWENKGNTSPIDDGMGGEIYNIPYKNSSFEGGEKGSGDNLDYVTIVVDKGTNNIITAFPYNGTYGIK